MSRITPFLQNGMSNEGQRIILPDGRHFEFVWSGLIAEVKRGILTRQRHGILRSPLKCHKCDYEFLLGDYYYNRKGSTMNRHSSFYCLPCAELISFIKPLKEAA